MNASNSASMAFASSSRPNFWPSPSIEAYIPSTLLRLRKMDFTPIEAYFGCRSDCSELGERT